MSEFSPLTEMYAQQRNRATAAGHRNEPARHRPRGRHALAHRLHSLADRLGA